MRCSEADLGRLDLRGVEAGVRVDGVAEAGVRVDGVAS
jgi:hypothetical protein